MAKRVVIRRRDREKSGPPKSDTVLVGHIPVRITCAICGSSLTIRGGELTCSTKGANGRPCLGVEILRDLRAKKLGLYLDRLAVVRLIEVARRKPR